MEEPVLIDPLVNPDENVLREALGKKYELYQEFTAEIGEKGIVPEWYYYRDAKSWLGKVLNKKKNLAWLSVWNTGFKLTFYFPEKYFEGFLQLDISDDIKKAAMEMKAVGKSRPAVLLISGKKILKEAIKIIEYKMSLK